MAEAPSPKQFENRMPRELTILTRHQPQVSSNRQWTANQHWANVISKYYVGMPRVDPVDHLSHPIHVPSWLMAAGMALDPPPYLNPEGG